MGRSRSFENNWEDLIMGEIELGSEGAYIAMAGEHDQGLSLMYLEHIYECEDADEAGRESPTDGPWGPWGPIGE